MDQDPNGLDPFPRTFAPWTRAWLAQSFAAPTAVQTRGWAAIERGEHALLVAPTGSGKTLAAFLVCIDRLMRERGAHSEAATSGVRVLYVSPLKALVHDVNRNLRLPLEGIAAQARALHAEVTAPSMAVRTGDSSAKDRRAQLKRPAEILVTTPESLYLMLGSRAREGLRTVDAIIVDEAHALADSKRGAHLQLSLERLSALTGREPQRIGLSATARPLQDVARFVAGDRPITVVDTSEPPHIELTIEVPALDMTRPEETGLVDNKLRKPPDPSDPSFGAERGMWSVIVPRVLQLIETHTSTIVFVNSRGLCERLTRRLNDYVGKQLVRSHHGSIAHGERREIEEQLKRGELKAIVATSSLELGIDMGAVDLVVLVESPGAVARGLQRVGRAGHGVGELSVGIMLPKHRGDLLEATVIAARMRRGEIEALSVPQAPLDVLAQQIVAMVAVEPMTVEGVSTLVRRAFSYRELSQAALIAVLDMLAGAYPPSVFAELRPRIVWDRELNLLSPRRGSGMVALVNGGTIPDRGTYPVHIGETGPRVGELDEEMVYETMAGEVFTLGASSFRVEQVTRDRVIVAPAPGELGKLPFWRGDGPGRPIELGVALGGFVRELMAQPESAARAELTGSYRLDRAAASNLLAFLGEQRAITGTLPTDRAITIECSRDEIGDYRVCILSPLGSRVHAPWALAISAQLTHAHGLPVQAMHTDDGIVLRFANAPSPPPVAWLVPEPDEVDAMVATQLASTALFAGVFRENATRALLLPRRRPGTRVPLWLQRKRASELLASALQFQDFPIVLETYRTCLRDIFDMPALRELLTAIAQQRVRVDYVETTAPSPFARSLVLDYVGANLYAGDSPVAEQRARLLTLESSLLRELLGQAALRTLLDPAALAQLEAELQRLTPERQARDADGVHDVLRALGDLSEDELVARCAVPLGACLDALRAQGRAVQLPIAGALRWVASEDAALYRDALGVALPDHLDAGLLKPLPDALSRLVARYARTRGPFTSAELAARYAVPIAQAQAWLQPLRESGALVHGELRPGGSGLEDCDAEVLRRLRLRTRAASRASATAVSASALTRFLPAWAGLDASREGLPALESAIAQLQGLPLPLHDLERAILPARVRGYTPALLDQLGATGVVCWVGCGRLGANGGRVALYLRKDVGALLDPEALAAPPIESGSLGARILEQLGKRGACFFAELLHTTHATHAELLSALQELMWSGVVTNDSLMALRAAAPRAAKTPRPTSRAGMNALGRMASGRFSLCRDLARAGLTQTERAHARAQLLLERHGIVSREVAALEELSGGFAALYPVLEAMEETGRVQRGYFVDGLGGAQFGKLGAIERLRACAQTPSGARVLAATDPVNPFGWALRWPDAPDERESDDARNLARRTANARVVIVDTEPVLFLAGGGKSLTGLPAASDDAKLAAAVDALRAVTTKTLRIDKIDSQDARHHPLGKRLLALGFSAAYRGIELAPR